MTVCVKTPEGQKTIVNVNIVRKPTTDEDTNYQYVCIDSYNQKRYFNEIIIIRG